MSDASTHSQQRFDISIGYLILITLLLVFSVVIGYGFWSFLRAKETRFAQIDRINNLRISDPVKFKGMDVGRVKKITRLEDKVIIEIGMTISFPLHQGYHAATEDIGIMGDQTIMIYQGDTSLPLISPTDTLKVIYRQNMSDMLGQTYKLPAILADLNSQASLILSGSEYQKSFVDDFFAVTHKLDEYSNFFADLLVPELKKDQNYIDSINNGALWIINLSQEIDSALKSTSPEVYTVIEKAAANLDKLEIKVQNLSQKTIDLETNNLLTHDQSREILNNLNTLSRVVTEAKSSVFKLRGLLKLGFEEE